MNDIEFAANLTYHRHQRGITQDELAAFLGITKASVSKWETGQSMPDVLLLPKIATYFNVSIDELLGYRPQLDAKQIQKEYRRFAEAFAKKPFEEVMAETTDFIKEYYSCYPAVLQICILWLNHFILAADTKRQQEILEDILLHCSHIECHCGDTHICNDALALAAMVHLQLRNPRETIRILEPFHDSASLALQSEDVLTQAYQMAGDRSRAEEFNQVCLFKHLVSLVNCSIVFLYCHMDDRELCLETIRRVSTIIDTYKLSELHPNVVLQFHYQCAVYYCTQQELSAAQREMEAFADGSVSFVKNECLFHGDAYFNRLDDWIGSLEQGAMPPRNKQTILQSILPALDNPALSPLFETPQYKRLKKAVEKEVLS